MDELYRELALLSDVQAQAMLNRMAAGLAATEPDYERLLSSPADLATVVDTVAREAGQPQAAAHAEARQPEAIRAILVGCAEDADLQPRLRAALSTGRATLLEPVTSALVLAGIVMLLGTHVEVHYDNVDGKKQLRVHVEKKPTESGIISKFFRLFG